MKQRTKALLIWLALGIMGIIYFNAMANYKQQEPKKYTCTLTDQQWQSVLFVINNPDDVSVNQRKQITDLIQKNLVAADTTKPKK